MKTLVLNWKMNPATYAEARGLFEEIKRVALKSRRVQFFVAPPVVFLKSLAESYKGKRIVCTAQDIFFEKTGSYTAGVSAAQLKDAGAQAVIVGHSEVRMRGDTDDHIAKKIELALSSKLSVVLCVGESARDKDGLYIGAVREQVSLALARVPLQKLTNVYVAYEPTYAIGAKHPPRAHEIHEMMIVIKKELVHLFGDAAQKVTLLYGGAVFPHTAQAILEIPLVSGFIVGRASLNPEEMQGIVTALSL